MYILQLFSDQTGRLIEINAFHDVIAEKDIHTLSECGVIDRSEFIVLLPGENVIVTAVELPRVRNAERARVAPFVLEEQLASEPESLYVVLGNTDKKNKTVVAAMDQSYADTLFSAVKNAGLNPVGVTPDFLAVRWMPETWTVVFERERALVRTGLQAGFAIDIDNVDRILTQLLQKTSDKPAKIVIWDDNCLHDLPALTAQNIVIERHSMLEKNKWDAVGVLSQLNVLPGKYRRKTPVTSLEKKWRWCRIIFIVWILFLVASQVIQYFYLHYEMKKVNQETLIAYQRLFPGANAVVEPHTRTRLLLSHYKNAAKNTVFLKSYRAVGELLLQHPEMHVVSFSFQQNQFSMVMDAPTQAILSAAATYLRAQNITVTEKNPKTLQNGSEITMVLS